VPVDLHGVGVGVDADERAERPAVGVAVEFATDAGGVGAVAPRSEGGRRGERRGRPPVLLASIVCLSVLPVVSGEPYGSP
jgi:hypothetical protein